MEHGGYVYKHKGIHRKPKPKYLTSYKNRDVKKIDGKLKEHGTKTKFKLLRIFADPTQANNLPQGVTLNGKEPLEQTIGIIKEDK